MADQIQENENSGNGTPPAEPPNLQTPEEITLPKTRFDERLNRAKNSGRADALKEAGFNSVEEAIQFRKDFEAAQKAADEAKRAEMNEIERLKADIEQRDREKTALEEEKAQAELASMQSKIREEILTACAEHGITNTSYAMFLVESAVENLENDDDELDPSTFLGEQIKDEKNKVAFGLSETPVEVPAQTTTTEEPPPQAGVNNGEFDAKTASKEQMNEYLKSIGVPGY